MMKKMLKKLLVVLVIVPFISYSQKLSTKTLKPVNFIQEKNNTFYTFSSDQTRFFYETKLLKELCDKKTLYKDSIIESQTKIIDDITSINKNNKSELDSCNKIVNKQVLFISKQDSIINYQHKIIDKKNIKLSFLSGTSLAIIIAMLFL
jgi:hypothetical protein